MGSVRVYLQKMRHWLKLDLMRELGRQYPLLCFLLLVLLLSTVLLNRYIHIIMGCWSFLAGMATFYCFLDPESLLPNFVVSIKPKIKPYQQELFPLGHSCAVCGKIKCKRHRPSLLMEKYQPWFALKVPSKVDASLSEFLELVLEKFVYRWYRKKTDDEGFIDELRVTLRFLAAVLVRRAQKVDLASLITEKLLKVTTKHIEIISRARQKVKSVKYLQQAALGEYGPDLHIALHSRRDELLYLRTLTEMMFEYILPPKTSDCRSLTLLLREVLSGSVLLPAMDYLADPDTANRLILLFFNSNKSNSQPEEATKPTSVLVPFLQMFSDARHENTHSALKLDLKDIREQQDLLFRFMNFLKQEAAVHVLQFYLTVEEFNVKILCPEMMDSEKRLLHEELKKIYETYCLEDSVDRIRFDPIVVEQIHNIAQGPYEEVVKLQTMVSLFEAHEHVLTLLEDVFIPMFCESDEYFHLLLRPASVSSAKKLSRLKRGSKVSRIGNKIKGVFKSNTMEGTMLPSSSEPVEEEDDEEEWDDLPEEAMVVLEDDFPDTTEEEEEEYGAAPRDLSTWNIAIPCVIDLEEDIKSEPIPVFVLIVERNDRQDAVGHNNWVVYRRYTEFYVLESRLTEFHGPFPGAQLPSKRIIGPKNYEFLSSKREEFQEYLQKLVQYPELSNSQLLAEFLSPHMESQFRSKILPDVNLGKIFKAVPSKLTIEKGQHLEPFIKSFRNSCKSPKPKPNSPELTILSPTSEIDKKLFSGLFKNNANCSEMTEKRRNQNCFMEMITVEGVYDYLMHIGRVVFHIPDWLHHLLMAGRILFKNTFEAYTDYCLQAKLDRVAQEHRLVSLITLLRDSVFRENSQPKSTVDIQKRAEKTFEEMLSYIPDLLEKCIGEKAKYEGVRLLFDGLQQPVLNKQLTYVLLDIIIQELFPELSSKVK